MNRALSQLRLGVLGGGQLGRMLALVAHRLGVKTVVYAPDARGPAGQAANEEIVGDYGDLERVRRFAESVDLVTYEFESVPVRTAEWCSERVPVFPRPGVLSIAQDRLQEKTTLRTLGFPVTPFRSVESVSELHAAREALGGDIVLKTVRSGYDGKGQRRLRPDDDATKAWSEHDRPVAIAEATIDFEREVSVVAGRGEDGSVAAYPVFENLHANHVLDTTHCPAELPAKQADTALDIAKGVMTALDVRGVMCVEMFHLRDGSFLINELAPRPHNSGHLTVDAFNIGQFELQLRAVCGFPIPSLRMKQPAAMVNLMGDLWRGGKEPNWSIILKDGRSFLHLYGKDEARAGRKMGHITVLADTAPEAREAAQRLRANLPCRVGGKRPVDVRT